MAKPTSAASQVKRGKRLLQAPRTGLDAATRAARAGFARAQKVYEKAAHEAWQARPAMGKLDASLHRGARRDLLSVLRSTERHLSDPAAVGLLTQAKRTALDDMALAALALKVSARIARSSKLRVETNPSVAVNLPYCAENLQSRSRTLARHRQRALDAPKALAAAERAWLAALATLTRTSKARPDAALARLLARG